jgi:glycogen synthase
VVGPPPTRKRQGEAASLDGVRLSLIDLPLDWMARDEAALRDAGEALAGICTGIRPDLVHLNSPAHACAGRWPMPLVAAFHSCVATWWRAVRGDAPRPDDFVWRSRCLHEGLTNADAVIAPSRAIAEAAGAVYSGISTFQVVHNGRHLCRRAPAPRSPTVFTSGRLWDEGKNMAALDAAAAQLPTARDS